MAVQRTAPKIAPKPEDGWHQARLIPTTGIGGQDEQEQRASSSVLAVMRAVPQFGRAILSHLDAPAGRINTFTEVRFLDADEKMSIPDGAIVPQLIDEHDAMVNERPRMSRRPVRAEGQLGACRLVPLNAPLHISYLNLVVRNHRRLFADLPDDEPPKPRLARPRDDRPDDVGRPPCLDIAAPIAVQHLQHHSRPPFGTTIRLSTSSAVSGPRGPLGGGSPRSRDLVTVSPVGQAKLCRL